MHCVQRSTTAKHLLFIGFRPQKLPRTVELLSKSVASALGLTNPVPRMTDAVELKRKHTLYEARKSL